MTFVKTSVVYDGLENGESGSFSFNRNYDRQCSYRSVQEDLSVTTNIRLPLIFCYNIGTIHNGLRSLR